MPRTALSDAVRARAVGHVRRLSRARQIKVRYSTKTEGRGFASHAARYIEVPPIKTAYDYLVALHELGHLLSRRASKSENSYHEDLEIQCVTEGACWAWAVRSADPAVVRHMTDGQWAHVGRDFTSYLKWAAMQSPARSPLGRRGGSAKRRRPAAGPQA